MDAVRAAFASVYCESDGYISKEQLMEILTVTGIKPPEVKHIVSAYAPSDDNIEFGAFLDWLENSDASPAASPASKSAEECMGGHAECRIIEGPLFKKTHFVEERYQCEVDFLRSCNMAGSPWKGLVPKFEREEEIDGRKYMVFNNLCHGMAEAMTLDIKIGTQSWEPGASPQKIKKMQFRDQRCTTASHGFRLTSSKIFDKNSKHLDGDSGKFTFDSLHCGRTFEKKAQEKGEELHARDEWRVGKTIAEVNKVLDDYFFENQTMIDSFLVDLDMIISLFREQTDYQFIGMSLFLVYDGDLLLTNPKLATCLIDFGHVLPGNGSIDHGCLKGFISLRELVNKLKTDLEDDEW